MGKYESDQPKRPATAADKVLTVVGIILCVVLVPMLIINCTLLIKGVVNDDAVPDFLGITPLIVLTDSMYPDIASGDLVFSSNIDAEDVQVGDVISFFDPASKTGAVVTHRVEKVNTEDGKLTFTTKGINNNTEDKDPVPAENLVGKYTGFRLRGAGHVALFMQTTTGFVVCVVLPLIALIAYDAIRRRIYDSKKQSEVEDLMAELEALRAAQGAAGQTAEADASSENP